MTRLVSLFLTCFMLVSGAVEAAAKEMSKLYDDTTLEYWQTRYSISTERILKEGIFPVLAPNEYRALAEVKLEFPLRDRDLINFYADGPPARVVLPVSALKFLDDLSIAYAWLWANRYRFEPIEEYLAMLKYKTPQEFVDGRYPPPLQALGIPASTLSDPHVDDLSLRFFNSARAFILAHELAHIYHQHWSSTISNEIQADGFALEILRKTGTVPMGAVLYFQATALWFPNRADMASDQDWQAFLRNQATHPLNADRLSILANRIGEMASDFARYEPNFQVGIANMQFISGALKLVVNYLSDADMQRCVAEYASKASPASFALRALDAPSPLDC